MKLIEAINRAKLQLNDPEASHWTVSELAAYAQEAVEDIARHKPVLFVVREQTQLSPGAEQRLPDGAYELIRIWSVDTAGVITYPRATTRTALSLFDPSWTTAVPAPTTDYASGDTPGTFWVYPPQPAVAGVADVEYVSVPRSLHPGDEIPIPDDLIPAIVDYMLFRAYSKDAIAGDAKQAGAAYTSYISRVAPGDGNG